MDPEEDFLQRICMMNDGDRLEGHFVAEPIKLYRELCSRNLDHQILMASPLEWIVRVTK